METVENAEKGREKKLCSTQVATYFAGIWTKTRSLFWEI